MPTDPPKLPMKPDPIRVLIAEDESHIRKLLSRIIATLGGQVVAEATDGEEAVRLFGLERPDLVVLDINMPRLTGDEALARIMALDRRVIAVMMTAQDGIDAVGRCLDLGAREYILKSNPAEEIFRILRESWSRYEAEVAAARATTC